MHDYREALRGYVDQDAVLFFCLFSRLEFALKRGGFLKGQVGGKAEPHWESFANALGNDLFIALAKAPQASIFFSQQPKRLVVAAANEIEFVKPADIKNLQMLFEAVKLVRNNLFHGEKVYVSQRDRDLMGHRYSFSTPRLTPVLKTINVRQCPSPSCLRRWRDTRS
ncbi:hypothetical protein [Mesorhizobium xinjiangense]|uniref:hypothetical protein n=1 Tax=Mesorhizobium xinjiangense TaxID=2678685 RepID=UPI0012EE3CE8|nr:hypothetical protein [Mesorhizobium xinjiangense]